MTHTVGKLLLAFLLWIPAYCALAQPVFLFPDYRVEPGGSVGVALKVVNFEHIVSTQFSIKWNPEVLEFKTISGFEGIELDSAQNFGALLAAQGTLSFSWLDMSLHGFSLPDSTQLFVIGFDIIGSIGDTSVVHFTDQPTIREIADTTFTAIPTVYEEGVVEVISTNSTAVPQAPFVIRDCYPNPFKESTQVQFHTAQASNTHISITNTQGQIIWEDNRRFSAGLHTLPFKKDIFPQPGTYFLRLQSKEFSVTQKLILVQ